MRALAFEEFAVGDEYAPPARTVTEADVIAFAGISGDSNPVHTDAVFAAGTPFGQRIAHGLLGLAMAGGFLSRAGVVDGTAIALLGVDWSFRAAVAIGDTLTPRIRVAEARQTSDGRRGIVTFAFELTNQDGRLVQEGRHVFMVRGREEPS